MNKCQDYPNMVFKGVLTNEGHSVTFNIFDDYVEITNTIICLPVTKLTFANYSEYTPGKLKVYPAPNFISSITYDYTWI